MGRTPSRSDDYWTIEEFLEYEALECPEDEKWELINGKIFRSMIGGTIRHNQLIQNINIPIANALRQRGSNQCRSFTENVRVRASDREASVFPDVVVTCSPVKGDQTTLENPVIAVEVLSKSTASKDRIEKWSVYAAIESLQHIVYVKQDMMHVESWTRDAEGWGGRQFDQPEQLVDLSAIGVKLTLAEIYEQVFE